MIVKILILDTFFPDFLSFWSIFDKKKMVKNEATSNLMKMKMKMKMLMAMMMMVIL